MKNKEALNCCLDMQRDRPFRNICPLLQFSFNDYSVNLFGNLFKSFLEDNVTCKLMSDGKEIASFTIDTSQIDLEKSVFR